MINGFLYENQDVPKELVVEILTKSLRDVSSLLKINKLELSDSKLDSLWDFKRKYITMYHPKLDVVGYLMLLPALNSVDSWKTYQEDEIIDDNFILFGNNLRISLCYFSERYLKHLLPIEILKISSICSDLSINLGGFNNAIELARVLETFCLSIGEGKSEDELKSLKKGFKIFSNLGYHEISDHCIGLIEFGSSGGSEMIESLPSESGPSKDLMKDWLDKSSKRLSKMFYSAYITDAKRPDNSTYLTQAPEFLFHVPEERKKTSFFSSIMSKLPKKKKDESKYILPLSEIKKTVAIYGSCGSGNSHLFKTLLSEHISSGKPAIVLFNDADLQGGMRESNRLRNLISINLMKGGCPESYMPDHIYSRDMIFNIIKHGKVAILPYSVFLSAMKNEPSLVFSLRKTHLFFDVLNSDVSEHKVITDFIGRSSVPCVVNYNSGFQFSDVYEQVLLHKIEGFEYYDPMCKALSIDKVIDKRDIMHLKPGQVITIEGQVVTGQRDIFVRAPESA